MKTQLMAISALVLSSFAGLGWAETGTPAAKGAPPVIQAGTPAPAAIGQKAAEDAAKAAVPAELGKGVKAAGEAVEKANDATAPKVPEAVKAPLQDLAQEAKPAAKPADDAAGKGQPAPEAGKATKPAPHKAGKGAAEPGAVR